VAAKVGDSAKAMLSLVEAAMEPWVSLPMGPE
jgi:hypothetical protein